MLNQSILMGRLTKDVELRYLQSGDTAVARFVLAVERDYKREGEDRQTDFINCKAFGKTAEFVSKYFVKGSMIAVIGGIQTGSYTNQDGQKVYTTEVVVNKASFTGEKREDGSRPEPQQASGDGFVNIPDNLDDLPFN